MFESLTLKAREPRRVAQPVLSFAIHIGLIALAVGQATEPAAEGMVIDPDFTVPMVIVDHDEGRTRSEVTDRTGTQIPRAPVIDFPVPGPVDLDAPGRVIESFPRLPASRFLPGVERSILDPGQPGDPGVYSEGDLSDSPVPLHFPQPVYPPALKAAGIEGTVQVQYVVDAEGHVEPGSITVVSTDHPFMAESVREALAGSRFRPGKVAGVAVRTLVRQAVRFSLMSL